MDFGLRTSTSWERDGSVGGVLPFRDGFLSPCWSICAGDLDLSRDTAGARLLWQIVHVIDFFSQSIRLFERRGPEDLWKFDCFEGQILEASLVFVRLEHGNAGGGKGIEGIRLQYNRVGTVVTTNEDQVFALNVVDKKVEHSCFTVSLYHRTGQVIEN